MKKTNCQRIRQISAIGLLCVGREPRDAGSLSEIHAKTDQHWRAELQKTALLAIWNDLPQEFIDKVILPFRKRLRSCVAAAGGHFEHSVQFKYREGSYIHHWNVWTVDEKVVQSLIHYCWIFRTRLKKWTLKFKMLYLMLYLLNHICYFNKICRICGLSPHL